MNSSRSVIEMLKFMSATDVLVASSVVSRHYAAVSNLPELWDYFCDLDIVHFGYPRQQCSNSKEAYRRNVQKRIQRVVCFSGIELILYDCEERRSVGHASLPIDVTASVVLVKRDTALVTGGVRHLLRASLIDFTTQRVTPLPKTLHQRLYHSSARVGKTVYLFGGSNSNLTAEKLHMEMKEWKEVPQMPEGRSAFTACVDKQRIYLCGGYTQLCHSFDAQTERYELLPLRLRVKGWCVASYSDGDLLVDTVQGERYRWNSERGESIATMPEEIAPYCQCSWANVNTVVVEGRLYMSMFTLKKVFMSDVVGRIEWQEIEL